MMLFKKFKIILIFYLKKVFPNFFVANYNLHETDEYLLLNLFFKLSKASQKLCVTLNILSLFLSVCVCVCVCMCVCARARV